MTNSLPWSLLNTNCLLKAFDLNETIEVHLPSQKHLMQVRDTSSDTPAKGKAACTKFTRISTTGTHSIVLCEPITGRTHQVREFYSLPGECYIICSNILR